MTDALTFVGQWGLMMAGMMLPGATPMILLYRTVSKRLRKAGDKAIPVVAFAAVYLLVWLLLGFVVYAGYVAAARLAGASPAFARGTPYIVAASLVMAGLYQFSNIKRVCLRYCESPLSFLMRRWRSGYRATFRLAFDHAAYCVGCCWALMLILCVAGAMSMPWVLGIAAIVFVEKILPHGWRMARVFGVALILLGIAVAVNPRLAGELKGASDHSTMQM